MDQLLLSLDRIFAKKQRAAKFRPAQRVKNAPERKSRFRRSVSFARFSSLNRNGLSANFPQYHVKICTELQCDHCCGAFIVRYKMFGAF